VFAALICATFFAALVLAALPPLPLLPEAAAWARPDWPLLVIVYWALAAPQRVGVMTAWIAGVALDVLHGGVLGEYGAYYALAAYFAHRGYQRLPMRGMLMQSAFVLAASVAIAVLHFAVQWASGTAIWSSWRVGAPVLTALMWPLVDVSLRWACRRMGLE